MSEDRHHRLSREAPIRIARRGSASSTVPRRALAARVLAFGFALAATGAFAQSWPEKPIRIVVPYGPGSGTDTGTRLLVATIGNALGQPLVVENKAGANGAIGAQQVARAAPDGYTFLMGNNSTYGGNAALLRNPGYDAVKDFVPVALVGIFPSVLVVTPSLPVRSAADLAAYAKANPGKLTYASGSASSVAMAEAFKSALKLDILRVPFQSNPPALAEVIAGRVSLMFPDISTALAHVKAGSVRPLAVVSLGDRSALLPEIPTIDESVMPGFHLVGWIGLFGPAGMNATIVERMGAEIVKAVQNPEFRQKMTQLGAEAKVMGPAEFRRFAENEAVRFPRMLRDAGVQPE